MVGQHTAAFASSLKDAGLRALSDGWKAALAFYAALQRFADADSGLAARLAPVQSFFQGRYARGRVVQEVVSEPQADATQEVTTATP